MKLKSYAEGSWFESQASGAVLRDAASGEAIGEIASEGLDFGAMLSYARSVGGPNLRRLSFHQRAGMLTALAKQLNEHRDEFFALSTRTGATRRDSSFDIDGGIGTLFVYGSKGRRELPNASPYIDGATEILGKQGSFVGQHIFVPLEGAAVHINAFNFPCWGMLEKLAPTLLAGMPAIVKPASSTAYLTEAIFRRIIDSGILPDGAVQLVCGSTGDLFDHLGCQDVIAFTGSKDTADRLRQHPRVISETVRFTAETDSLNCSVLGPSARPGTPEFDLYVKEVVTEITMKAGQKCTAIRRIIAPEDVTAELVTALSDRLAAVRVGNPANDEVRMGALASLSQREEVKSRVAELGADSDIVYGDVDNFELHDGDRERGAFLAPILLHCRDPHASEAVHSVEAFGPVSTVLPYRSMDDAVELANRGDGSLAASIFTADDEEARRLALGIAPWHGRILIVNRDCAKESTGHGAAMPHLVHGGPGRAGGGEELGGIRGVLHYMQRTALQGSPTTIGRVSGRWIRGGARDDSGHPLTKPPGELEIGDAWETVLAAPDGADAFAIAGETARQFIGGSAAATTGMDELRVLQPVAAGDELKASLTCRQINPGKGLEVRWDADIRNGSGEPVASFELLTLIREPARS